MFCDQVQHAENNRRQQDCVYELDDEPVFRPKEADEQEFKGRVPHEGEQQDEPGKNDGPSLDRKYFIDRLRIGYLDTVRIKVQVDRWYRSHYK